MGIEGKQCTKCKEFKDMSLFGIQHRKDNKFAPDRWCKVCRRNHSKAWAAANKEKKSQRQKIWRFENKEKVSATEKLYRQKNIEMFREIHKRASKRSVNNLTRSYVAKLINGGNSNVALFPEEMIEAKRMQLLIKRTIKEMTK